jgi:hypothetical protein
MMLHRCWPLLLLFALVAPLSAQEPAPEPAPEEPTGDKPAEEAEAKPDAGGSIFRWRVGAGIGLSNGTLATEPEFDHSLANEGIIGEFSMSARVTHRDSGLGLGVRACWGCHGIELEQAYLEWKPLPVFALKAGRMRVAAGSYNARHDFNTRRTISKPLTRTMGNMVRQDEFNLGVLPAPYVDNGLSFEFGLETPVLGWTLEGMVMAGLKGPAAANDIDFVQSRQFADVNNEPALGARMGFELPMVSLNFSYLWGNYDPEGRRSYNIVSADARLRLGAVTIDGEFAWRETEFSNAGSAGGEAHFQKFGWVVVVDWQVFGGLSLTGAVDALYVTNIFLSDFGPTPNPAVAITDDKNRILRMLGGVSYTTIGGLLFRVNAEFWEFSDFNDAWVIQAGIGWAF